MSGTAVSPDKLFELHRQGLPLDLIDVRTPAEYREAHIEFARNIPLHEIDPRAFAAANRGERPLYFICRSGSRAHEACQRFVKAGFTNVVNVEGGTAACEKAGLPLIHGAKTISLERQVRIAAGALVFLGTLLGWLVHAAFLIVPALVGAGLVFSGVTDTCGMGMLLARMPWNRDPSCQIIGNDTNL